MNRRYLIRGIALSLLCTVLVTGCEKEEMNKEEIQIAQDTLEEGNFATIPASVPKIRIDENGYDTNSRKIAMFIGEDLSDTFELVDANTRKVVYRGKIQKDSLGECYLGYFTQWQQDGTYFIRTDTIGESYPFEIRDGIYFSLFQEGISTYAEEVGKNEITLLEQMPILFALEFFPEIFPTNKTVYIGQEVPTILVAFRKKADAILGEKDFSKLSRDEWMGNVAFLASLSSLYESFDASYASKLSLFAQNTWNQLTKNVVFTKDGISEECYLASSALYKITGYQKYHQIIRNYHSNRMETTVKTKMSPLELYADITYMSTKKRVDIDICNDMMQILRENADQIASRLKQNGGIPMNQDAISMLEECLYLSLVDYIITSHEYSNLVEDYLHFISGCNLPGIDETYEVWGKPVYYLILGEMADHIINREDLE